MYAKKQAKRPKFRDLTVIDFRRLVAFIATITIATIASNAAMNADHPVTAAMMFVMAVLINGAMGGMAQGLAAALAASFIYNFFIRFPVYVFGFTSIDDYFPVFALSLTAIMSGGLSGRLKDRAQAAERAQRELTVLLRFSADLQKALTLQEIAAVLCAAVPDRLQLDIILTDLQAMHGFREPDVWNQAVALARLAPPQTGKGLNMLDRDAVVSLATTVIERCELLQAQALAAAAIKSEQLKTALLSSLSHDLRTPLAAISASASGLRQYGGVLDGQSRAEMLDTIQEQCTRLENFTGKLLSLGRLEAGLASETVEIVDVEDVLGSAIGVVRRTQETGRIICDVAVEPVLTRANPVLLEQVLTNLIENAIRYSDGAEIAVSLERVGESALMTITDQGIGISPGDLPHVFERFYRGCNVADRHGHGLGLSIAKAVIEASDGTISAVSPGPSGAGTQIRISLPHISGAEEVAAHG